MRIRAEEGENAIIFQLNDNRAAKDLYEQLPLTVKVEDFGGDEKIFYPLNKLSVAGVKIAAAKEGTLAYYEPWGDVVLFYKNFGTADGLYELGSAIAGIGRISHLSGEIMLLKDSEI